MSSRRGARRRRVNDAPMRLTLLLTTMCAGANATTMQSSASECVGTRGPPIKRDSVILAVIAPADPRHEQSLSKVLPAVHLAVRAVSTANGPLPGRTILVEHRDSKCSSTYGALAAFDFYINRTAGSLLFPRSCLAPLASVAHRNRLESYRLSIIRIVYARTSPFLSFGHRSFYRRRVIVSSRAIGCRS